MATGTFALTWQKLLSTGQAGIAWNANTSMKAALMLSTYTTVVNRYHTNAFWGDVSTYMCTGTTAQALPVTLAASLVTSAAKIYLSCGANVSYASVPTAQACTSVMIYRDSTVAGTSELIANLEFTQFTTNGQNVTVNFGTGGIASFAY